MAEFKATYNIWWDEISPSYKDQPYIYIGHEKENPVNLFCHDWHSEKDSPWHQRHIRIGYIDNGHWLLKVAESGQYNLKLRRWPVETNLRLNAKAPIRPAKPGTSVSKSKESKALIVRNAKISIQDIVLSKEVDPNLEYVEFEVELEEGETSLKTWFNLETDEILGAYYVSVEKL